MFLTKTGRAALCAQHSAAFNKDRPRQLLTPNSPIKLESIVINHSHRLEGLTEGNHNNHVHSLAKGKDTELFPNITFLNFLCKPSDERCTL